MPVLCLITLTRSEELSSNDRFARKAEGAVGPMRISNSSANDSKPFSHEGRLPLNSAS